MKARVLVRLLRPGSARVRWRAVRDGQAAVRVAAVAAGLRTGVLVLLDALPDTTAGLARRGGWAEEPLLEAFLRMLSGLGLVRASQGRWHLTRQGRAVLADDVVRSSYEAFSGYHTGLYRDLERQLTGGAPRRDVVDHGELIARLSQAMDPFVTEILTAQVRTHRPRRIIDVGCGTGRLLAHMLQAAPEALGVGIEQDPAAAALARATLAEHAVAGRARVVEGDARGVLGNLEGEADWVLVANMLYYLPPDEQVVLLRAVAGRLRPGGAVLVISTVLTDTVFSRHFDLLLRAQQGRMALPTVPDLTARLRAGGLTPGAVLRIVPGQPVVAVVATRPGGRDR